MPLAGSEVSEAHAEKEKNNHEGGEQENVSRTKLGKDDSDSKLFQLYKRQTTIVVKKEMFLDVVCDVLSEYKYVGANQRADLILACRYCIFSPKHV